MMIECPNGVIKVNDRPVIENLRLNLASNNQARIKMNILNSSGSSPLDIVVYKYTLPKLEKLSIVINIDGVEMTKNVSFNMRISCEIMKRKWILRGFIGKRPIDQEIKSVTEVLKLLQDLIL